VRGNDQSVETELTLGGGRIVRCRAVTRAGLLAEPSADGPLLIIDAEATTYVPPAWVVRADRKGSILLRRAPVA
jgi:N-methylhydantoinase A/oxoprolinase/acetone carboxylase beta subunit